MYAGWRKPSITSVSRSCDSGYAPPDSNPARFPNRRHDDTIGSPILRGYSSASSMCLSAPIVCSVNAPTMIPHPEPADWMLRRYVITFQI